MNITNTLPPRRTDALPASSPTTDLDAVRLALSLAIGTYNLDDIRRILAPLDPEDRQAVLLEPSEHFGDCDLVGSNKNDLRGWNNPFGFAMSPGLVEQKNGEKPPQAMFALLVPEIKEEQLRRVLSYIPPRVEIAGSSLLLRSPI
jgi:hypothetical protein